jgi:catechol 2,3-dioxygenase-like lactoylglutathione lyase family enzyme
VAVTLNHTIVHAHDTRESAKYYAQVLGQPDPKPFGPFMVLELANGVSLDFMHVTAPIRSQHYAFLVSESEFDAIFGRIREREIPYWADPGKQHPNELNRNDGGRGVYWEDPNGHLLEIITRPYGG